MLIGFRGARKCPQSQIYHVDTRVVSIFLSNTPTEQITVFPKMLSSFNVFLTRSNTGMDKQQSNVFVFIENFIQHTFSSKKAIYRNSRRTLLLH